MLPEAVRMLYLLLSMGKKVAALPTRTLCDCIQNAAATSFTNMIEVSLLGPSFQFQ